jgi:hypothetical protein
VSCIILRTKSYPTKRVHHLLNSLRVLSIKYGSKMT